MKVTELKNKLYTIQIQRKERLWENKNEYKYKRGEEGGRRKVL